jgi:hypothetical protein
MTDLLTATAYHEASHALIRHHFGCRIAHITIDAEGCGLTRVLVPKNNSDYPWRVALCALAGPLGEAMFTSQAAIGTAAISDMRTVAKALVEGGISFDSVFDAAAGLINHYRSPITRCAQVLLQHGRLDERGFCAVVIG